MKKRSKRGAKKTTRIIGRVNLKVDPVTAALSNFFFFSWPILISIGLATGILVSSGCSILCPIFPSICEPTPIPSPSPVWSPTPTTPIPTLTPQATSTPAPPPVRTATPHPSRSPSPAAPSPSPFNATFGSVIATFPASVPGAYGSIDFKDGQIVEYCHGTAKLFLRRISDGEAISTAILDSRMAYLWAVAWDAMRNCYWATNPEEKGINWNLIQLSQGGQVIGGNLMLGGTSDNPIRIYDIEVNWNYATTIQGDPIDAGTMFVADRHVFSGSQLIKVNYITTDVAGYWEQFWWAVDISFRADARTGCTYWLACDTDNPVGGEYPIYEYRQALYRKERCDASARTGRKIIVPGVWFTSLRLSPDGNCLWGKGINVKTGVSAIYVISLGLAPGPAPSATPSIGGGGQTPSPSPVPGDIPYSITFPDSTVQAVAVDAQGYAYVTGSTTDPDFCRGFDVYRSAYPGESSVYAAKISPAGQKVLATYISTGNGQGIAVDREGNIFLGGGVSDDNWPVTAGAFQSKRVSTTPYCYLCKLDPNMKRLIWSTYIGAAEYGQHAPDSPDGSSIKNVLTDDAGACYWIASSQDNDFPVTRCIIGDPGGPGHYTVYVRDHAWGYGSASKWSNVFAGKFSAEGKAIQIVNVGGGGPDTTSGAFAVSPSGGCHFGARTKSTQGDGMSPWPSTIGAFRGTSYNGGQAWFDGAAVRLNQDMTDLAWASFLGGHAQNNPFGGDVDNAGRFTVTGYTKASDFPVVNAIQPKFGGDHDCFVSRFTPAGSALDFSTFLGGPGYDSGSAAAVDSLGRPWVCGQGSKGYPTTDGSAVGSSTSSVISRISADGRTLEYSTTKHGGQDATGIAFTPGYYIVTITAGDDGRLVKERQ